MAATRGTWQRRSSSAVPRKLADPFTHARSSRAIDGALFLEANAVALRVHRKFLQPHFGMAVFGPEARLDMAMKMGQSACSRRENEAGASSVRASYYAASGGGVSGNKFFPAIGQSRLSGASQADFFKHCIMWHFNNHIK